MKEQENVIVKPSRRPHGYFEPPEFRRHWLLVMVRGVQVVRGVLVVHGMRLLVRRMRLGRNMNRSRVPVMRRVVVRRSNGARRRDRVPARCHHDSVVRVVL